MNRHTGRKVWLQRGGCGMETLHCKSCAPRRQDQHAGLRSALAPKAIVTPKHGSFTLDSAL